MDQFARWATTAHPPVLFWLSGFTFPTGFLTAVLQASARNNKVTRTPKDTQKHRR
jgi:dynein heavy chain